MRDESHDSGELPKKVPGLPVAGYRPQSPEAIAAVNAMKIAEEQVLRLLDETAGRPELAPDPRWLAIGRTAIEQGFMAVNRAIMKPQRLELHEPDELGWVLERADSETSAPLYFAPVDAHASSWSTDPQKALRFARKIDASSMALAIGVDVRVCEHAWSAP